MRSVELFVGAGGLAMGIARAGFSHDAVVEWDHDACETIRENRQRGVSELEGWRLFEADVKGFDYSAIKEGPDLLAGGPPCQPFSLGGKHRGFNDQRDMFPEMTRAIRELKPRAVLIENVRGLLRPSFAKYFEYIVLSISYPDIILNQAEPWTEHLSRLERAHTQGERSGLTYQAVFRALNAADYGVPQRRERVLIVAFRSDLGIQWSFPNPTHSLDALLWNQWVSGEYWERHEVATTKRPDVPDRLRMRVDRLQSSLFGPTENAWATVRDAISDLPDAESETCPIPPNHRFVPGARSYAGHTGSPYDEPAKTLKAGDHGVPGGENTLAHGDGQVRYFTVRESARLQTFPDDYVFHGSWSESMRQLGNAVPVKLGQLVAGHIKTNLIEAGHG